MTLNPLSNFATSLNPTCSWLPKLSRLCYQEKFSGTVEVDSTYDKAVVCLGRHPVELNRKISTGNIKIIGRETGFGKLDVNGSGLANVVEAVLHDRVHAFDEVFVLNLKHQIVYFPVVHDLSWVDRFSNLQQLLQHPVEPNLIDPNLQFKCHEHLFFIRLSV